MSHLCPLHEFQLRNAIQCRNLLHKDARSPVGGLFMKELGSPNRRGYRRGETGNGELKESRDDLKEPFFPQQAPNTNW